MVERDKYGADTVSLLRYFTNHLPSDSNRIYTLAEENQVEIVIPSIVIGELIYTVQKGKTIVGNLISDKLLDTILTTLYSTSNFIITNLTQRGWYILLQSKIPELHDRMIVATCIQEGVQALLTSDHEILISNELNVIW